MQTLQGKTVVIVGAGSGMGLAVANMAVAQQMKVVAVGRTRSKLEAIAGARAIAADVTKDADLDRLFSEVGAFDHLVVTAHDLRYQTIATFERSEIEHALGSKLVAALLLAKHATKHIAKDGSLVFTSGIAGDRPMPRASVVASANAGLGGLARALAVELGPVRVNVISPGWVDTPVWDRIGMDKQAAFEAMAARLPTRRTGTPDDFAHAVRFLMENGFVTGTVLEVDGGHRLV